MSIKIEVDTNPPAGAVIATTLVRRHVTIHLCHYDRASLFAGKLHAILSRPWVKWRDLYDLAWYLADPAWPPPNIALLNAALAQTGWTGATQASSGEKRPFVPLTDGPRSRRLALQVADIGPGTVRRNHSGSDFRKVRRSGNHSRSD